MFILIHINIYIYIFVCVRIMLIYLWCIILCIHIFLMIAITCRATLAQIVWAAWLMQSKRSPKESQRFGSKSHTTQETGHRHIYSSHAAQYVLQPPLQVQTGASVCVCDDLVWIRGILHKSSTGSAQSRPPPSVLLTCL